MTILLHSILAVCTLGTSLINWTIPYLITRNDHENANLWSFFLSWWFVIYILLKRGGVSHAKAITFGIYLFTVITISALVIGGLN